MGIRNFLFNWRNLGIERSDLVLEVGSGNRPIARSDVLCDMGAHGRMERFGGFMPVATVRDRPFVFADAHRLPFRDRIFDYLYSAHMLEHLERPAEFLEEARRVARRGCIVTPSPTFERLFAEPTHLWYVDTAGGVLTLDAKSPSDRGAFGPLMQHLFDEEWHLRQLVWNRTDVFETRYFFDAATLRWAVNGTPMPDDAAAVAEQPPSAGRAGQAAARIRSLLGTLIRISQGRRTVDLDPLLACVECRSPVVHQRAMRKLFCRTCAATYDDDPGGAPVMLPKSARVPAAADARSCHGDGAQMAYPGAHP